MKKEQGTVSQKLVEFKIFWCKSINTLAWQWLRLTTNPLIWIFSAIFILITQIMVFYFGNWIDRNQADLYHLFYFFPWVIILFAAAITMGGFAQEKSSNTIELSRVFHFSGLWQTIMVCKATYYYCLLILSFLSSLWFFVSYLGNPDHGIIISSIIGALLLSMLYISCGFFVSSFTKNSLATIIITIFVLLLFSFISSRIVLDYLSAPSLDIVRKILTELSPLVHYYKFTRGEIAVSSVIYLLSLNLLFIFLTWLNVYILTKKAKVYKLYAVLIFAVITFISSQIHYSFDATKDKRYTLSNEAQEFLANYDQDIDVTIYYSSSLGRANNRYDKLLELFETKLSEINRKTIGTIHTKVVQVELFEKSEEEAVADGIAGVAIDNLGNEGYFGMSFKVSGEDQNRADVEIDNIPFVTDEVSSNFENEILKRLVSAKTSSKLKIALLTKLPIVQQNGQINNRIISNLSKSYELRYILTAQSLAFFDPDYIIIVEPGEIDEDLNFVLEQHLAKGKSAVIFLDPFLEEYSSQQSQALSSQSLASLSPLLTKLGISIDHNQILKDNINPEFGSVQISSGSYQQTAIPIWLRLTNADNNYINLLDDEFVFFASASNISLDETTSDFDHEVLFRTSKLSEVITQEDLLNQDFNKILSNPETSIIENDEIGIVAVMAKGEFNPSFNKSDLKIKTKAELTNASDQELAFNQLKENALTKAQKVSSIAVISDTDVVQDSRWYTETNGVYRANATAISQLIDKQNNFQSFSNASKTILLSSPFTKLENIRKESQQQYLLEEQTLLENILKIKSDIRDMDKESQEAEIEKVTEELNQNIERIRKIRYTMKKDITYLANFIKIFNVYVLPLMVLILGLLWCRLRQKLIKRKYSNQI